MRLCSGLDSNWIPGAGETRLEMDAEPAQAPVPGAVPAGEKSQRALALVAPLVVKIRSHREVTESARACSSAGFHNLNNNS